MQKSDQGTYTYDVKLNYKNRDSTTWKKNLILHTDGTKTEHGFVSMIPAYDTDEFFVTWLDGRNTLESELTNHENGSHSSRGAMTLRGARINLQGNVVNSTELDHSICDCCQTSAAMTLKGPVVVYRDRTEEEIRDISIVRWQDNDTWTAPSLKIQPQIGNFYIFSIDQQHIVYPFKTQDGNGERRSVSFNAEFRNS